MAEDERIPELMVRQIVERFRPTRVVPFGSRARGQAEPWSNVDLLVVLPKVKGKRQATVEILRALGDPPLAVDIVVSTPEELARRGHAKSSVLRAAPRGGRSCMKPMDDRAEETLRWLCFAQEDLMLTEKPLHLAEATPHHICWLVQQAAEKALKAALPLEEADVPRCHNLDALRNLLPEGWRVKQECPDLAEQT